MDGEPGLSSPGFLLQNYPLMTLNELLKNNKFVKEDRDKIAFRSVIV